MLLDQLRLPNLMVVVSANSAINHVLDVKLMASAVAVLAVIL